MKKFLALFLVLIAFFLWSPTWTPVLAPMGRALASIPAVEQFTVPKDVKGYDYYDPDVQMLMVLTSYYYSRTTGACGGFNSGFAILRVTSEEMRIVSHELTHVLQIINGALPLMPKTLVEYQAEFISRFVMSIWAEAKLYGSLNSQDASPLALERFKKSIQEFEN